MIGKAHAKTFFLISGIWLAIALVCMRLSLSWLMGAKHQSWGALTALILLGYLLFMIGWLIPLICGLIRVTKPPLKRT